LLSRIARFAALLPVCLALCAAPTLCLGGEAKEEELEPVKIELPLPVLMRPYPIKLTEHIEKPSGRPRPPFLAPKGTRNVALGKPVTSKDDLPHALTYRRKRHMILASGMCEGFAAQEAEHGSVAAQEAS